MISLFDHEDGDDLLASFRVRLAQMEIAVSRMREGGIPVIYVNDQDGR
jgi:hypothetical protein